jgi:hypothetical protein
MVDGFVEMTVSLQGEIVLRHLERFLGPFKARWLGSEKENANFQVLLFSEHSNYDFQCLTTFGLSAVPLHIASKDAVTRMEFMICANLSMDSKALVALLMAVGRHATVHWTTPGIHGVLAGSGAVLTNPVFEHFYLTCPGYLPTGFGLCESLSPPVVMGQLVPVSSNERELIEKKGWRAFEYAVVEQGIDLLAFDNRKELNCF